jgi:hypothetical protein
MVRGKTWYQSYESFWEHSICSVLASWYFFLELLFLYKITRPSFIIRLAGFLFFFVVVAEWFSSSQLHWNEWWSHYYIDICFTWSCMWWVHSVLPYISNTLYVKLATEFRIPCCKASEWWSWSKMGHERAMNLFCLGTSGNATPGSQLSFSLWLK